MNIKETLDKLGLEQPIMPEYKLDANDFNKLDEEGQTLFTFFLAAISDFDLEINGLDVDIDVVKRKIIINKGSEVKQKNYITDSNGGKHEVVDGIPS